MLDLGVCPWGSAPPIMPDLQKLDSRTSSLRRTSARMPSWHPERSLHGIMESEGFPSKMALQSESEMGITSWLEDELYQQYLHDRSAVDESWKTVFEEPRPAANGTPAAAIPAAIPAPEPAPGAQLLPLPRPAGRRPATNAA